MWYVHRIKPICGMHIEFNEWDLIAATQCDSPTPRNIQDTFDWKWHCLHCTWHGIGQLKHCTALMQVMYFHSHIPTHPLLLDCIKLYCIAFTQWYSIALHCIDAAISDNTHSMVSSSSSVHQASLTSQHMSNLVRSDKQLSRPWYSNIFEKILCCAFLCTKFVSILTKPNWNHTWFKKVHLWVLLPIWWYP